jgi:hypothetical protein
MTKRRQVAMPVFFFWNLLGEKVEMSEHRSPIMVLRTAYNIILTNPVVFYPLWIMAFVQLFILEIFFFAPRQPLAGFFAPLITNLHGETFLHYPYNFALLIKWFDKVQIPLYVFFDSFFLGAMVLIIDQINDDKPVDLKKVFKTAFFRYIHLCLIAALSAGLILKLTSSYQMAKKHFLADPGAPWFLKKPVFYGDGVVNLMISVLVLSIFAFVIPIIMIEKKNFFSALVLNFKNQLKSLWLVFILILLPSLLYVPIFLLRMSWQKVDALPVPELSGALLVVSVFVWLFIDAMRYTAVTTYYLLEQGK